MIIIGKLENGKLIPYKTTTISFNDADNYSQVQGITTFRGNNQKHSQLWSC